MRAALIKVKVFVVQNESYLAHITILVSIQIIKLPFLCVKSVKDPYGADKTFIEVV